MRTMKMKRTQWMMPPKLLAKLKAEARAEGISMGELARRLLRRVWTLRSR